MRGLLIIFLLFLCCGCIFLPPSKPKHQSFFPSPHPPYQYKTKQIQPTTSEAIPSTFIKCTIKNETFEEVVYIYQGNIRTEVKCDGKRIISVVKGKEVFLKTENFSLPNYENCSWILFPTTNYQNFNKLNESLNISMPDFGKKLMQQMKCEPTKINNSLFIIPSYCIYNEKHTQEDG